MALQSGSRLGPYEVLAPLGAGGMGEVYRARDPRLGRDVAVKVLPEALRADPDRLHRFEQEARAAGALNHPNVLVVLDVGTHDGVPYVVSELLQGETLRERLRVGGLTPTKAVECAVQIAQGLAAAHEKGITHRDLKPENLFLTKDGRVKILDFGLAKLREPAAGGEGASEVPTLSHSTEPGAILGSVGYMSPEQVRGLPADHRSDIFSLGAVLYEMLSRRRAFAGESSPEVLTAILKEDPPELSSSERNLPPALGRIVRRCLEKRPEDRFHSAHDLGLALEAVSASTAGSAGGTAVAPSEANRGHRAMWRYRTVALVLAVVALAGAFLLGRRLERTPVPSYRQLTFRRGIMGRARFAPDGQTVIYSAEWEGKPSEVFSTRLDLTEAQALSLAHDAHLVALRGGEALVLYQAQLEPDIRVSTGRLARIPVVGGTLRDVAEDVIAADWGADGDIAILREASGGWQVEYPIGKILWKSKDLEPLREVRMSPGGDHLALVVGHLGANGGDVVIIGRNGTQTASSSGWMDVEGLAWSPDGREVWFTAGGPARNSQGSEGTPKGLYALSLSGSERLLLRTAGDLTLLDVFRDGRTLIAHGRTRTESRGKLAGDERERDLTYLDGTVTVGISSDGRAVLFQEAAQAGGPVGTAYLLRVGDPGPIRLGEGNAMSLSPDGRQAIAGIGDVYTSGNRLVLLSAGAEPPRELPRGTMDGTGWVTWADGEHLIVNAKPKGGPARTFIQQLPDGQPQEIVPDGYCWGASPDGWVMCYREKGGVNVGELRSPDGRKARPVPWIQDPDRVIAWSSDGRHAFVSSVMPPPPPFRVSRVEVATGRREPWLDTSPPDRAGLKPVGLAGSVLTPDGRHYAYAYARTQTDLFLVEGLR
jgi:hypothetical protein